MGIAGDGGVEVLGPGCRRPRHGLESVADVDPEVANGDWLRGAEWDEDECGYDVGVLSGQCPPLLEAQTKVSHRGYNTLYADAFTVYAGWDCTSGALESGEAWNRAESLLSRGFWTGVERALWTGVDQDGNGVRSSLGRAGWDDVTPGGGAVGVVAGLSTLLAFAADCMDCEPVIHAPVALGPYLDEKGQVESDGGVLRLVATGTPVALGVGYPRAALPEFDPGGVATPGAASAAGEMWVVVSGPVRVTTGQTFFAPDRGDLGGAVDRLINDITVYAEKFAMLQLGCCVGAIRVAVENTLESP